MATQAYDLRVQAENVANWNEDFVFDITIPEFFKSSTVVMFEILDFNPTLIIKNSKLLNADKFYPVAWGYIRPLGVSQVHLAKTKIQLYHYRGKHHQANKMKHLNLFDGRRPEVLLELAFPFKSKYASFLEIEINFHEKPVNKYRPQQIVDVVRMNHYSRYPWEEELGLKAFTVTEHDDFS